MKVTIRFQLDTYGTYTVEQLESQLRDLLITSVLPTLNADLIPGTLETKKAR
jgi:hypothetical protein